jgi:hypothetical protein
MNLPLSETALRGPQNPEAEEAPAVSASEEYRGTDELVIRSARMDIRSIGLTIAALVGFSVTIGTSSSAAGSLLATSAPLPRQPSRWSRAPTESTGGPTKRLTGCTKRSSGSSMRGPLSSSNPLATRAASELGSCSRNGHGLRSAPAIAT